MTTAVEPILQENENRFVIFPIQHHDLWEWYKKCEACFSYKIVFIKKTDIIKTAEAIIKEFSGKISLYSVDIFDSDMF